MAINIELIKSLNGRSDKQVATANSLGLRKIGDKTCQPDNPQTKGKVKVISHLTCCRLRKGEQAQGQRSRFW